MSLCMSFLRLIMCVGHASAAASSATSRTGDTCCCAARISCTQPSSGPSLWQPCKRASMRKCGSSKGPEGAAGGMCIIVGWSASHNACVRINKELCAGDCCNARNVWPNVEVLCCISWLPLKILVVIMRPATGTARIAPALKTASVALSTALFPAYFYFTFLCRL